METADDAFAAAVDHHRGGRLEVAESLYRRVIAARPDHPAALNNLGLMLPPEQAVALFRRAVAAEPEYVDALVNLSSALQARGEMADAAEAYTRALSLIPDRAESLFQLGHVLQTQGRVQDAAAQYERAIRLKPDFAAALCNLGIIHTQAEQPGEAAACYRRALACDPGIAVANLNMISILEADGRMAEAKAHRSRIARPQALVIEPAAEARRTVLLLANTCLGNIPLDAILPTRTTTRITWHVEFATEAQADALPRYDVAFNVVGNADVLDEAQPCLERFAARHPLLNAPAAVARTRRDRLPALLDGIAGVVVPRTVRLSRADAAAPGLTARLEAAGITAPALIRPIAGHGGDGAERLDTRAQIDAFRPGEADAYYAIAFHDYARADGHHRKYRMIFVDRAVYPYHLAISEHWLVHYFSAAMMSAPWKREEERRFLEDPVGVLGPAAMAGLAEIARRLDLDFAGIDFTLLPDGRVLVFEANATMLVHLRDNPADYPYKHAHVPAIFAAFDAMLDRHASPARPPDTPTGPGLACPAPLP